MTNCVCILIFNACEFRWPRTCWPQKVAGGGQKGKGEGREEDVMGAEYSRFDLDIGER